MSEVMSATTSERLFKFGMKVAWGYVACTSLYAVLEPRALLDLNSAFWGILLFVSLTAFPSGMATDRVCAYIWGTLLLGLTITYVIFLRAYQTSDGAPIGEIDFLQQIFTMGVAAAGIITGIRRFIKLEDAAEG
ncbi:hypothetical protein G6L37_06345 [Agrobacterium rubi]|nr:hypothetical protein [Agrobacterium rubi]NTF24982.1 hypothetical protein [Agrobacterium rubi]